MTSIFRLILITSFVSCFHAHANNIPVYSEPFFKVEDTIESDARLTVFAHDFTYDKRDGDVTNDYVFYRNNDQEPMRFDFANQDGNSNYFADYSNAGERNDAFSWGRDDSYDIASYVDVESNRREMQSSNDIFNTNDDSNEKTPIISIKPPRKTEWPYIEQQWPNMLTVQEEFALWEKELAIWPDDSKHGAVLRLHNRKAAYSKFQDDPCHMVHKKYNVSKIAVDFLENNQQSSQIFKSGHYNSFQHYVHKEFIACVQEMATLDHFAKYPKELKSSEQIASFATLGVQYNKIGDVLVALTLADFCWSTLECAHALLRGIGTGIIDVTMYAVQNPHELVLYGLAPEIMSGYYTLKLMYSLGSLATDMYSNGLFKSNKMFIKDVTMPNLIYGASAFAVRWWLNKSLDGFVNSRIGVCKESFVKIVESKQPELCFALAGGREQLVYKLSQAIKQNKRIIRTPEQKNAQALAGLNNKQLKDYDAFLEKTAKLLKVHKDKICFSKILPKNPKDLTSFGWIDITHPNARLKGNLQFEHLILGIKLRFDKGRPGESGFTGIDHYQISNPIKISHRYKYLDRHAKLLESTPNAAHITLESLKNKCC